MVRANDISNITAKDDVDAFLFIHPNDIDYSKLAFESDRVALDKYQKLNSGWIQGWEDITIEEEMEQLLQASWVSDCPRRRAGCRMPSTIINNTVKLSLDNN